MRARLRSSRSSLKRSRDEFWRVDWSFQTNAGAKLLRSGGGIAKAMPRRQPVRGVTRGRGHVLGNCRLEGDYLGAGVVGARREELNAACNHLDRVSAFALVLPRSATEAPVDPDALSLRQVFRAQLRLTIPGGDPDEVGAAVLRAPVDREQELRHALVLADLAQFDVRRKVPDQYHYVHVRSSYVVVLVNVARQVQRPCVEREPKRGQTPPGLSLVTALIGVPRFELGTSPTRTERATRLRHTPSGSQISLGRRRLRQRGAPSAERYRQQRQHERSAEHTDAPPETAD